MASLEGDNLVVFYIASEILPDKRVVYDLSTGNNTTYRISVFFRGSQISRFSSKLVYLFLAVFNFHDPVL